MSETADLGAVCARWWTELTNKDIGRSRAEWAQLRRASSPMEALLIPATHRLNKRLAKAGHDLQCQPDRLALVAMALAQVKTSGPRKLAVAMGQGEPPALSALRFDKLIRCDAPDDLARQLRRALAQVNHQAHVAALARDLLWWNETTRARWCFEYYGAAGAVPEDDFDKKTTEKTTEETGA